MTDNGRLKQEFSWYAHPARERSGRAVLGSGVILGIAALSAVFAQNIWWGVFAAFVLVLALNRFFFRSRFVIDPDGITARYPLSHRRLRWTDLRRFMHDENGGYLSTRARRSRLDGFQGMHILFGGERPSVVERIGDHMPEGGGVWAQ